MNYYMKNIIFALILIIPGLSFAERYEPKFKTTTPVEEKQQIPWQCKYANSVVVFEFGDWDITPSSVQVMEGDKVCVIIKSNSYKGATFNISNLPIGGAVKKGSDKVFSFTAKGVGKHKVNCVGTCNQAEAYLEVMDKEEYKKIQDEINKYRSINNRPAHILGN